MTMNTETAPGVVPGSPATGWGRGRLQQVIGGLVDALSRDIARNLVRHRDWKVLVLAASDGVSLFHRARGKIQLLAKVGYGLSDEDVGTLRQAMAGLRARREETVLRLAPGKVIIKEVSLPQAAAEYVPVIIRNRIERLAPWPLGEAVFGHQVLPAANPAGQIVVRVAVTGRRMVDGLIAGLARAGIVPGRTDVAEDTEAAEPIGLSTSSGDLEQRVSGVLKIGLAVAAVALLATAAVGFHRSYAAWRDLSAIDQRIAELQSKLAGSQAATARERATMAAIERIIIRKATEQPFSAVLGQLTAALPDGSWLTEITYRRPELTVTGKSPSVPPLVKALESVPIFADANFAAPTRREPGEDTDIFSIRMTVLPGQGGPP